MKTDFWWKLTFKLINILQTDILSENRVYRNGIYRSFFATFGEPKFQDFSSNLVNQWMAGMPGITFFSQLNVKLRYISRELKSRKDRWKMNRFFFGPLKKKKEKKIGPLFLLFCLYVGMYMCMYVCPRFSQKLLDRFRWNFNTR